MKLPMLSLCLVLSSGIVAHAQGGAAGARVPEAERTRLLATVPKPLPAPVTAPTAATFYTPAHLYEYMDGGADIFLLYNVQAMLHQDLKAGKVDVTLDIFDMGSVEDAFGMYTAERSPNYDFVETGAEGYRNEGIVNFLQDRYYVKLAGFGDGADKVLDVFARAIAARIGGNHTFPALITALPTEHRAKHTEQYMRKDPLGHPYLSPAYQADYDLGKGKSQILVSVAKDAADAAARMKSLADHFKQSGQCAVAPEFGEGAIRATNSYEGTLIARTKGRYLVLLLNPPDSAVEFFKNAIERIP